MKGFSLVINHKSHPQLFIKNILPCLESADLKLLPVGLLPVPGCAPCLPVYSHSTKSLAGGAVWHLGGAKGAAQVQGEQPSYTFIILKYKP